MIIEANRIWILVAELVEFGVSENTIKSGLMRNRTGEVSTWAHRAHPNDKRIKLLDFDCLPESTKQKLPTREQLAEKLKADTTESQLVQYTEATKDLLGLHTEYRRITDYHFFFDKVLNESKANDLTDAAGWLRMLFSFRTISETRTINYESKAHLRQAVVDKLMEQAIQRKRHLYGFKITSTRTLQVKEGEWANAYEGILNSTDEQFKIDRTKKANLSALATLVNGNFGNNTRRIIGALNPEESERKLSRSGKIDFSEWNAKTLCYLYMNPGRANKYDFENIQRRYKHECAKEGREPAVELTAIKNFLNDKEVKLFCTRERSGWAEHDKALPHVFGKKVQYSFSKGGYDGFQVDFYSRIEGKRVMLTVVAAFDYASGAITGFDIGMVEDGLMVRNMWRNHLNLNNGRSYIEIESDRFSGNLAADTRAIFEKTCQRITQPTPNDPEKKASNPKGRYVERLIQELNRLVQKAGIPGWKGTNITSIDKGRKPNPDYSNKNYTEGLAEGKQLIIELVNMYNHDKYEDEKTKWEVLTENVNPDAPIIQHETIAMLLNQSTIVKVTNGLVAFEANRREYEYEFSEFDLHAHKMMKGYRVKVYYDESDMSSVDVFGENDAFIATLGRLKRVARAKAEQTQEDIDGMGRMIANRNKTQERLSRKALEIEASVYGLDISNMGIEEATEVILGARETMGDEYHIDHRELYSEALTAPDAKRHQQFFEDRLITAAGEAVPVVVTKEERKSNEQKLRDHARSKYKNQYKPNQDL